MCDKRVYGKFWQSVVVTRSSCSVESFFNSNVIKSSGVYHGMQAAQEIVCDLEYCIMGQSVFFFLGNIERLQDNTWVWGDRKLSRHGVKQSYIWTVNTWVETSKLCQDSHHVDFRSNIQVLRFERLYSNIGHMQGKHIRRIQQPICKVYNVISLSSSCFSEAT